MALLGLSQRPGLLGGQQPVLPRIPWSQNPMVTMAGLSLLGGRNINEGFQNLAANAPAGMAAKSGMQQFMLAQQEKNDALTRQKAAWNAGMKWKSGVALTPEEQDALAGAPDIAAKFMPESPQPTDDLREYSFAKSQGFNGSFQDWQIAMRKAGATTVDARQMGTIPPGYKANYDDKGNIVSMEPIPGGPEDTSGKDKKRESQKQVVGDIVLQDIGRAIETIEESPGWTTGIGGTIMKGVPGSSAKNLDSLLTTIKANIGFDRLQQMREASPTGGALGQVAVQEIQALQSVLGSVEQAQDPEQLSFNLRRLYNMYLDIVHGPENGPPRVPLDDSGGDEPEGVPEGIDPADWEYMTPEQKALFR